MNISNAEFVKGVVEDDPILWDGRPQIVFIGRSNVGKSSVINSLTNRKDLARSSPTPGKTKEANFFLINKKFYFVDLPGYGFAQGSHEDRQKIQTLIEWFFFESLAPQSLVIHIIDSLIGLTESDEHMLKLFAEADKNVLVLANKIDKVKPSKLASHIKELEKNIYNFPLLPYSAEKKTGINELLKKISECTK